MKKRRIVSLLGALAAFCLCWVQIHFWMAPLYSHFLKVSHKTAYLSLMTLSGAYTVFRIINILRDKDEITKMIDDWHKE
jgi:hypothetical protein